MTRHLKSCLHAQESSETLGSHAQATGITRTFHLVVQGRWSPGYWLHLQVRADATLRELDGFLRQIWLECCGHMSAFRIGEQSYSGSPMGEMGDKSMECKLRDVLQPGMQLGHEYDFGSTTELLLKVAGEQVTHRKLKSIELLARNDQPLIACTVCGNPALQVCTQCGDETGGWLCGKCAKKHECDPEMRLPVVNSPRVGVCGYTG